jgi:hypothetical protein
VNPAAARQNTSGANFSKNDERGIRQGSLNGMVGGARTPL